MTPFSGPVFWDFLDTLGSNLGKICFESLDFRPAGPRDSSEWGLGLKACLGLQAFQSLAASLARQTRKLQ